MSTAPPNALFSALSFIGFILAATPLPWHLQSWNTGTCLYMLWTSIGCLILFANSIVWNDNVINWAPVWCDISSRYIIGASVGIPASSLCISRRLYYLISSPVIRTKKNKRREITIDLSIGLGLPFLVMALQYVVQDQRFIILEEIGCFPATVDTILTYFLVTMWPLLLGLISMIFAALTFRQALRQKAVLKKLLYANCSISTTGRYWRLMALCATEIIFTVPMSIYSIVANTLGGPPAPYVSWAFVHADFSAVGQVPSVVWQSVPVLAAGFEITRWSFVLCAFVIFSFFGWAKEARDYYRRIFWYIARLFGYQESVESLPSTRSQRPVTFSGNTSPLDGDHKIKLEHSSVPIQVRVKYDSYRVRSLTTLDVENLPGFILTTQTGADWTASESVESPTLGLEDYRHLPHTSWLDMPAAPPPTFTGGRPQSLSEAVGQAF